MPLEIGIERFGGRPLWEGLAYAQAATCRMCPPLVFGKTADPTCPATLIRAVAPELPMHPVD
ncbi:MAG: hypothetical protein ACLQVI_40115 [Polyangiaceae bacterium]